jgi:hypothetical protein
MPTARVKSAAEKTVDAYIASLPADQAEIVAALRALVRKAAPKATEAIKWAQPVFDSNGPMIFIKAHRQHVNFGFWRGAEMQDPEGLLEGEGERMRHVKLTSLKEARRPALAAFVRQAVRLNAEKGDPTKGK